MKIALYHHLPSGGGLGHFAEVAKALKDSGHTLALFTPGSAEQEFAGLKDIVDHEMVFHRIEWRPLIPILNPMLYRTYLGSQLTDEKYYVKHIMEFEPDVIYLGQCRLWTEPPLLRYLPKELPKVLYCAEPKRSFFEQRFIDERKKWPWWKKMWRIPTIEWMKGEMKETILNADAVLCNSQYSQKTISKVYPGVDPIFTPIGVNCDIFKPNSEPPKKQLISVGALDPSKNHDMAIKVAAECADLNFKVVIVTDRSYGDTADQLINLASEKNVELKIKERISQEDLISEYAQSFATIYCPDLEPFGRVSIESQACGTPVLGVDEGGLKETIISKKSGDRFERKASLFAEQLKIWSLKPELYQNYRINARKNALDNWNQEITLKNHVKTIENLAKLEAKKV